LANDLRVRSNVDAINLVLGHVTLNPLNLRPQRMHDAARSLRNYFQLLSGQFARSRNVPLDHVSRHRRLLGDGPWARAVGARAGVIILHCPSTYYRLLLLDAVVPAAAKAALILC